MKYLVSLALIAFFFVTPVRALDLSVSGNGQGSNNSVNIQQNNTNTVQQSNTANINNNVKSNADSGGNNTNGGSVTTGDAESSVTIKNNFNKNSASVDDCCKNGETPPTPPDDPGDGNNGGNGGSNGGSSGGSGGGSSSSGSSNGAVLGLSATAGPEPEQLLFYVGGAACLALGAILRRNFVR